MRVGLPARPWQLGGGQSLAVADVIARGTAGSVVGFIRDDTVSDGDGG
jgi:hypothetical protein